MKNGIVLAYSNDVMAGVIRSLDGKRLFFSQQNWKSDTPASAGQTVTFNHTPDGHLQIFFGSDVRTRQILA